MTPVPIERLQAAWDRWSEFKSAREVYLAASETRIREKDRRRDQAARRAAGLGPPLTGAQVEAIQLEHELADREAERTEESDRSALARAVAALALALAECGIETTQLDRLEHCLLIGRGFSEANFEVEIELSRVQRALLARVDAARAAAAAQSDATGQRLEVPSQQDTTRDASSVRPRTVKLEADRDSFSTATGAPKEGGRVRIRADLLGTPKAEFEISRALFERVRQLARERRIDLGRNDRGRRAAARLIERLRETGLRVRRPDGGRPGEVESLDVIEIEVVAFRTDRPSALRRFSDESRSQRTRGDI